ncbi:GNVR domain-containing protein [Ramlibacter sp. PS4R-6]|uniref:GNVR domain-containing protein n=1 Tax=Ramlibacter sp. PS4R-6 TaxID=3133438 RepID=UPI0030ADB868
MTWARFQAVLAGRFTTFVVVLSGIVGLAAAATLFMPAQYTARAQVLVQARTSAAVPAMANHVANEADLVRSERVSVAALRLLGLQADPAMKARWQEDTGGRGDFESWAGEQLLRRLDVRPARESNILTVAYSAADPARAAATANAFVQAYLGTSTQIREEGVAQTSASFEPGTRQLQDAVTTAEAQLAAYQREHGITTTDDKLDADNIRLAELNAQYVVAQMAAATATGRERQAGSGRGATDEVLKDPLVTMMSAELVRQEARLEELRPGMGSAHPRLIEQQKIVDTWRSRVGGATRRASSSAAAESRIAAERVKSIQAAMDAQRAKVLGGKSARDEAARLQRGVDLARRAYDGAILRMNESGWDSSAARGSASIVRAASVPAKPSFPRPIVNLVAALVVGLIAGIAAAFWREARDRRLRLPDDVMQLLDRPLLGVLSRARLAAPAPRLSHA